MKKSLYWVVGVLGVLLAALGLYLLKTQEMMKTLPFICIGIGCGMFGHGMGELLSRAALNKHPELAKQLEIEQKDERNVMLANLSRAKGFTMMTYVFAALLLVYALMGASYTVILPFAVAYLFVQGYAVYCRVRMEKEQ